MSIATSFSERFCIEVAPVPVVMTIFGASGDLARIKLFPALCRLFQSQLFHPKSQVVAFARTPNTTENFREQLRSTLQKSCEGDCTKCAQLPEFLERIHYVQGDYGSRDSFELLSEKIQSLETTFNTQENRLFYLSVPASIYATIVEQLGQVGLTTQNDENSPWRNVMIEKPFGYDEVSAKALDVELTKYLKPSQIFRIDHYTGKETVQNLMMLRFANQIFEPLWNHQYIESVQISALETVSIGARAGYYDTAGAVRDMFQNHLLQMMAFIGMEAPQAFDADALNVARTQFLDSIIPPSPEHDWVRGQYMGYTQTQGVNPDSQTETYAAVRLYSNAPRWQGVPFYLQTGKCLQNRETTITIQFKKLAHEIFAPLKPADLPENILQIYVQPAEGMRLSMVAKKPGPKLCIGSLDLSYQYAKVYDGPPQEAYERLILEAMLGDATLFIQSEAVYAAWRVLDPTLRAWADSPEKYPLYHYAQGSSGPDASQQLLNQNQHTWIPRVNNGDE